MKNNNIKAKGDSCANFDILTILEWLNPSVYNNNANEGKIDIGTIKPVKL